MGYIIFSRYFSFLTLRLNLWWMEAINWADIYLILTALYRCFFSIWFLAFRWGSSRIYLWRFMLRHLLLTNWLTFYFFFSFLGRMDWTFFRRMNWLSFLLDSLWRSRLLNWWSFWLSFWNLPRLLLWSFYLWHFWRFPLWGFFNECSFFLSLFWRVRKIGFKWCDCCLHFNIVFYRLFYSTFMITFIFAACSNRFSVRFSRFLDLDWSFFKKFFFIAWRRFTFSLFLFDNSMFWLTFFGFLGRSHAFFHLTFLFFHSLYFLAIFIFFLFKLDFNFFFFVDLPIFIKLSITETFVGLLFHFIFLKTEEGIVCWVIVIFQFS